MKLWLNIVCHLFVVSCCLGAPTVNVSKSDAAATNQRKTSTAVEKSTRDVPKTERQESRSYARKREIPDALVDHPEDFDESSEDNRGASFEIPSAENSQVIPTSNAEEDAEYPYYTSEYRRKRTADRMLGRTKRGLEVSPETAGLLLDMLNSARYANRLPRPRLQWDLYERDDEPGNGILEDPLNVAEPIRDEYWPGGLPPPQRVLPSYPKLGPPLYQRNVL